jgi:hypothetical protein
MVHKLRTTRRIEAIVSSFILDQEPEMRRLLKAMKPVRKAAGVVCDKGAGNLLKVITVQRKRARRHFMQCLRLVRGGFSDKKLQTMQASPAVAVAANLARGYGFSL